MSGGMNKFHECVRAFINNDKQREWSPRNLYADTSDKDTAEKLTAFFNNISTKYTPLNMSNLPQSFEQEPPLITAEQVTKQISEGKKLRVKGDIFINVFVQNLSTLAKPITTIFNNSTKNTTWPADLKTEYVTIILKKQAPETESDCPNISCTNFLSKVYERIVLG